MYSEIDKVETNGKGNFSESKVLTAYLGAGFIVYSGFQLNVLYARDISPPQTQRTHMADDVLRTRRGRRENQPLLCARSVFSVSLR